MKKWLTITFLLAYSLLATAAPSQQPLPADQAFSLSAKLFGNDTVVMQWKMAPGHYLYRERLQVHVLQPANAKIGQILYPPGQPKHDAIFGDYQIYTDTLSLPIPIIHPDPTHTVLTVTYQGCAEDGYCYPPITQQLSINFSVTTVTLAGNNSTSTPAAQNNSQEQRFIDLLSEKHIVTLLLAFFGFGILLSFTPCVLPMVPILSGIIVGHQKTIMAGKTFRLSLVYVLSMALTYAVAGVLIGWAGGSVQTLFQQPWVIVLFSLLFVLLALSFFGLYTLRLPTKFEERIANISRHQKSGHYLGVAIMGCLATLIVSPCVTPALVGVFGYISKTGDAVLGGAALFALGLGMGLPLLAIGVAGGKLLPRAGAWMKTLEHLFGVLFLAVAIWMLERIIPGPVTLLLWATLLISCAVYMGALSPTPTHSWGKLWKGLGLLLLVYGILLVIGSAQGNSNLWQPIALHHNATSQADDITITPVKSMAELDAALAQATTKHKPILLDFYASWCVSCQIMERTTYKHPQVQAILANFTVLKADVTRNDAAAKALMQHFQVIAPPTFVIFNARGELLPNLTRVGEMNSQEFSAYLQQVLAEAG